MKNGNDKVALEQILLQSRESISQMSGSIALEAALVHSSLQIRELEVAETSNAPADVIKEQAVKAAGAEFQVEQIERVLGKCDETLSVTMISRLSCLIAAGKTQASL
jgi:hypothetical protein